MEKMTTEESLIYEAARLEAINRKLMEMYKINEERIKELDKKFYMMQFKDKGDTDD